MDSVFGYNKTGFLSDDEIDRLYAKKSELVKNKETQQKVFQASMYDPRKSDVYFGSKEGAQKAEKIARELNKMSEQEFLDSNYPYEWLDKLKGETIFKVINKKVLKSTIFHHY